MEKPAYFYENIFICVLFAIGVTLFYGNSGLRAAMVEPLTPGTYGQIITATFCITCILRLLWINVIDPVFIAKKRNAEEAVKISFKIKEPFLIVLQMVLMILYALGITRIGYFITTFFYILITMITLTDKRNKKTVVIYAVCSLCFCLFLQWAFGVFYIMMPNTPLW